MTLRRVVSLTACLSFLLLACTSVILFVEPHGRVAYWSGWTFWSLSKTQWGDLHLNLGALFLLAAALHLWLNFKPLVGYLKNRMRKLVILTPDAAAALALCLAFAAGTLAGTPPFSWLPGLGEHIKDQASLKYGEPPYGHAELSTLAVFLGKMGWAPGPALDRLRAASVAFEGPQQTLEQVAAANGVTPQRLFEILRPEDAAGPARLPDVPPAGIGRRPLADVCHEYGLTIPTALRALKEAGIEADPAKTLKELAAAAGRSPTDVYEILRATRASP
jgi:hypothetical protein